MTQTRWLKAPDTDIDFFYRPEAVTCVYTFEIDGKVLVKVALSCGGQAVYRDKSIEEVMKLINAPFAVGSEWFPRA